MAVVGRTRHAGFSYVEVLLAVALLVVTLPPALDALQTGLTISSISLATTERHLRLTGRTEDVLARPFETLRSAAAQAGDASVPSTLSDPADTPDRLNVYVSLYDLADEDLDGDPFSVLDADLDGDADPYTGGDVLIDVLWVRVEIEGTDMAVESLTRRFQ